MNNYYTNSIIDLYNGAYGLTLYVMIQSDHHLEILKSLFADLAHGWKTQITLDGNSGFVIKGIDSISLVLSNDAGRDKTIFISSEKKCQRMEWKATSSQWQLCLDLLNGFVKGKPGHQYLSKEGIDDVLVKVSFLEKDQRTQAEN